MGFAARSGKLEQHSGISPVVDAKKYISCGICVNSRKNRVGNNAISNY